VTDAAGEPMIRSIHYTGFDPKKKAYVHLGPNANGSYEIAQSADTEVWHAVPEGPGALTHPKLRDEAHRGGDVRIPGQDGAIRHDLRQGALRGTETALPKPSRRTSTRPNRGLATARVVRPSRDREPTCSDCGDSALGGWVMPTRDGNLAGMQRRQSPTFDQSSRVHG
jgi:hypothetical protein